MNGSLEFKRLIPWLRAVGALIAALLTCVQETASAAVLFQIMCPRVDPPRTRGDVSPASLRKHAGGGEVGGGGRSRDVWQNTPLKRPFITLPNQAERGEVYNCDHQLLSHWSCRYFTVMCYHYEWVCVKFMNFIYFLSPPPPPQSCERLPPRFILSSNDNIQLTYLIPQYVHMKTGVRRVGRRCKKNNAQMKTLCLAELLIAWVPFSRQISPRGWLNTIAVPSSKSQVCAAKHATQQWKLAVWMMVITLATEAANASFQEGAVWWASLMSVQEQEFIYLLEVWLNCIAGRSVRERGCLPNNALSLYAQSIHPILKDASFPFGLRNAKHPSNMGTRCS